MRANRKFTGISGGVFNCRYLCSGIRYTGISLGFLLDIKVLCSSNIGVQIEPRSESYSSSDAYLHNIWVDGPQCTPGSIGIVINGTDNNINYVRSTAFEIGIQLNGQTNHLTHCHPMYSDLNASAVHNNSVGYEVNAAKQFFDSCYSDNFATSFHITGNYPITCNNFNQFYFTSGSSYTHTFCKFDGTQFSSTFINTCLNYTANGTKNYGYVGSLNVKPYSGAGFLGLNLFGGISSLTLGKDDKIFNPSIYKDQSNLNPLYQKTMLFVGDSICQGYGDQEDLGGYVGRVGRDNVATVYNYGVGGAKITEISGQSCICTKIDTMYAEHPDADYVIMEGGINDADWLGAASTAEKFGTFDETDFSGNYDKTTFCGAVEYMFYKASTLFPNAKLGFIIVCKSAKNNNGYFPFAHNYRAYFDMIAILCGKWGISCLDLWETSPANPSLQIYYDSEKTAAQNQSANSFYIDGKHPTAKGYSYMSERIGQWLRGMSFNCNHFLSTRGGVMRNSIVGNLSLPILRNNVTNGRVLIAGGTAYDTGSMLWLYGKTNADNPGVFSLSANDGTNSSILSGTPGGTLQWKGNDIALKKDHLLLSGGTMTGDISFNKASVNIKNTTSGYVGYTSILGGDSASNGSSIRLNGKDNSGQPGQFVITANNGTQSSELRGYPNGTLSWNGVTVNCGSVTELQAVAQGETKTITMNGNSVVILVKRGNNSQMFACDYWTANAVTLFTIGSVISTVTKTANSKVITVENSGNVGAFSLQVISGKGVSIS